MTRFTQTLTLLALLALPLTGWAQTSGDLFTNFRPVGQPGVSLFEAPKEATRPFDGLKIHVGGDFALQFQGLSQSNNADTLLNLAPNFTLPTANLNLDVLLAEGMRMHLRTYLSSRHHTEAYVKGGYLQIDNLDWLSEGFLSELMEVVRLRAGMDEYNYGDTHFRRSDNAQTIYNPFVGNYIMDAFSTEPFAEVTVFKNGFLGVAGITNGRLNQTPISEKADNGIALFGKLGFDRQVNEDLRVRLTGSIYHSTKEGTRDYLYGGDRAGARYYEVLALKGEASSSDFFPRFNPGFKYHTAYQINPFVKFMGLEGFGVVEVSSGGEEGTGSFTQLGGELLYRFGMAENFYVGGRYNIVSGKAIEDGPKMETERFNVGGGWFLTNNVLTKVEYVKQTYSGDGFNNVRFGGAEFSGVMVEATISF